MVYRFLDLRRCRTRAARNCASRVQKSRLPAGRIPADRPQTRRVWAGAVFFWVVFLVAGAGGADNMPSDTGGPAMSQTGLVPGVFPEDGPLPVFLYFADVSAPFLVAEQRPGVRLGLRPGQSSDNFSDSLSGDPDPAEVCRRLMAALAAGPESGLSRTLPKDAAIRAVFVEDQTAYIDFSREVSTSHPGGILSELMTLYSVVNTLVLNVDAVDKVKILIAGQDAETLCGHIDIRFPLNADILLIK